MGSRASARESGPRSGARPRAIPEATVARLTNYLHVLTRVTGKQVGAPRASGREDDAGRAGDLAADDEATISSERLAALAGVNSAKLRKDLSYLGSHGTRGVGYDTAGLVDTLQAALGAHRQYPVVIAGCGHLGSALAGYSGFAERGFPVAALLDSDPSRIGSEIGGIRVSDIREALPVCRAAGAVIGVIATPDTVAQSVANVLIKAGIRSILNFAPKQLDVPADVELRRVDLALELNLLAFHESRRADLVPNLAEVLAADLHGVSPAGLSPTTPRSG